jgi:hypothetical protein
MPIFLPAFLPALLLAFLPANPPACLPACMNSCRTVNTGKYFKVCLSSCHSFCTSVFLSASLCDLPPVCLLFSCLPLQYVQYLSVGPLVCLPICMSVCLYAYICISVQKCTCMFVHLSFGTFSFCTLSFSDFFFLIFFTNPVYTSINVFCVKKNQVKNRINKKVCDTYPCQYQPYCHSVANNANFSLIFFTNPL